MKKPEISTLFGPDGTLAGRSPDADNKKKAEMQQKAEIRRKPEGIVSLISLLLIIIIFIFGNSLLLADTETVREIRKVTASELKKDSLNKKIPRVENQKTVIKEQEKSRSARAENSEPVKDKKNLQVIKENKFLEQELSLAKSPQYYFVIDLKEKKIELRARGMVLKSWTARDMRYLGPAVPLEVTALKQKSALNPPKRLLINPAENQKQEEATASKQDSKREKKKDEEKTQNKSGTTSSSASGDSFEVPALEITDMPVSYELILTNGLQISIRTRGKEKTRQSREMISWYILRPIKNLFSGQKEQNPRMVVYFEKDRDAQGLYWAFIDGLKGIIWFP